MLVVECYSYFGNMLSKLNSKLIFSPPRGHTTANRVFYIQT
jgi:hypothetical protein